MENSITMKPISIQNGFVAKCWLKLGNDVFRDKCEIKLEVKCGKMKRLVLVRCCGRKGTERNVGDEFGRRWSGVVGSVTPFLMEIKRHVKKNYAVILGIAIVFLVYTVKAYMNRKSGQSRQGSVADLVKRGQLRSDRRGISEILKYDDPFNNPLVKINENNSTVEMCGKVYRLAPVTLTEREQSSHQKRRSRAYQWKRPTMFIKEGDSMPPDVDPDTVRWIPANHPFATTVSDIDEDMAQTNVYQKDGVPFRIKAEHEALQRKLEALQNDQKLDKLGIDPNNAKDFERPYKSFPKSNEQMEQQKPSINHNGSSLSPKADNRSTNPSSDNPSSEEQQKL